jgi:hypothetical protein
MVQGWTVDIHIPSSVIAFLRCFHSDNHSDLFFSADTTTVEYLIDQPTEENDQGTYLCNVTSASGFDIGEIKVDVLGKFREGRVSLMFG